MAKISELGFEIVQHPPYSPDLAPSDYFLFGNLKNYLSGKRFCNNNNEVMSAVNEYFGSKDVEFYSKGMRALEHRWTKYIAHQGEYIE